MKTVKISFLILNCDNTQMKGRREKGGREREKGERESVYQKVKSIRVRFVYDSAMISIRIEHSKFRNLCGKFHYIPIQWSSGSSFFFFTDEQNAWKKLTWRQLISHEAL